jgi:hypothetical protein
MNIYLDDDSANQVLAQLLRQDGHEVQVPADVGLVGASDLIHFGHAISKDRLVLTGNHDDFRELQELVIVSKGHHPGVLVVRRDIDPTRDLTPRGVVRAVRNLAKSGIVLADVLHILNHWR